MTDDVLTRRDLVERGAAGAAFRGAGGPVSRLLNLGLWHTRGPASAVPLDQELAQLVTLRDGLIVRDQNCNSWKEGLRAAGLEPDAIALPARARTNRAASSAA